MAASIRWWRTPRDFTRAPVAYEGPAWGGGAIRQPRAPRFSNVDTRIAPRGTLIRKGGAPAIVAKAGPNRVAPPASATSIRQTHAKDRAWRSSMVLRHRNGRGVPAAREEDSQPDGEGARGRAGAGSYDAELRSSAAPRDCVRQQPTPAYTHVSSWCAGFERLIHPRRAELSRRDLHQPFGQCIPERPVLAARADDLEVVGGTRREIETIDGAPRSDVPSL